MIQKIIKIANYQATKLYFYNAKMILLGETCYSFNNKTVILNNLFVNESYRNQYIGSSILKRTEQDIISKNNHVNQINLVAYDNHYGGVAHFFQKNGYVVNYSNNTFDNGLDIYNLVNMSKKISTQKFAQ